MKKKTFYDIYGQIRRFVRERNWHKFHNPKDMAEAIVIESSELLELFLWKDKKQIAKMMSEKKYQEAIREEVADILIYSFQLVDHMGYDLEKIINEKMKKNAKKYPLATSKGAPKRHFHV